MAAGVIWICGERGITCGDPFGGHPADPNYSLTHFIRKGFYFTSGLAHAGHGSATGKIKIPRRAAGVIWICGERGIRTPGTVSHTAV